jgi:hypothetical protein
MTASIFSSTPWPLSCHAFCQLLILSSNYRLPTYCS